MNKILLILVGATLCLANECIKNCETHTDQFMCSSLLKTLAMPKAFSCYTNCNVTMLHPHTCECPNNCHNFLSHGECINSVCQCNPEWAGADCSIPKCQNNPCSRNGRCLVDRCICNSEWTGFDCSSPVLEGLKNPLPFGQLVADEEYWSDRDEFKDFHPIYNQSSIASIHVAVNKADLASLYDPANVYFHDYIKGNLTIDVNGRIHEFLPDIGLRVKGKSSRTQPQKNLIIALDKFGHKDRRFFGIDRIGLKYNDVSNIKYAISLDLWRSVGSRTQRHCFANLFINGIHYGLMWMAEEITKDFLRNRYQNHKGNLYKMDRGRLVIEGQGRPIDYMMANRGFAHGRFRFNYNLQTNLPGNFQDLTDFILKLNKTSNENFDQVFGKIFDVDRYIRSQIVELVVNQPDGYTLSNANYQLYHDPKTSVWDFIPFDPQHSWEGWRTTGEFDDWAKIDPYKWGFILIVPQRNPPNPAPLTTRIIINYRKQYTFYWRLFLQRIWRRGNGPVHQRINDYGRSLIPQIQRDYWQTIWRRRTVDQVMGAFKKFHEYIDRRHDNAIRQLDPL